MSEEPKDEIEKQGEMPLGPSVGPQREPAAEKPPDAPQILKNEETIGEILLAARERAGFSLEFMSEETKIPKQTLQYLETDNFEALPAKVYVKGFLRTYASALGLDIQHILSKYEVQTGQTHRTKGDHWEIETEVVEEKVSSVNLFRRIVVPLVVVAAVVLVVIKIGGRKEEKAGPPRQPEITEEVLQKKTPPQPQPVEAAETETVAEPMELKIIANPTDSSWIELVTVSIVDQAPETTAYRFMLPLGRSRSFQATEEFILKKVGNAGGIVMELNNVKLPSLGKKGKVVIDRRITREDLPRDLRNR